jgi:hypothetical protein
MLRVLQPRSHLHPLLSRSFLISRCQRSPDNKLTPDEIKTWLKSKQDATRKRAGEVVQTAFGNLALLGGKLNKISGYEEIEALKAKVSACGIYLLAISCAII